MLTENEIYFIEDCKEIDPHFIDLLNEVIEKGRENNGDRSF